MTDWVPFSPTTMEAQNPAFNENKPMTLEPTARALFQEDKNEDVEDENSHHNRNGNGKQPPSSKAIKEFNGGNSLKPNLPLSTITNQTKSSKLPTSRAKKVKSPPIPGNVSHLKQWLVNVEKQNKNRHSVDSRATSVASAQSHATRNNNTQKAPRPKRSVAKNPKVQEIQEKISNTPSKKTITRNVNIPLNKVKEMRTFLQEYKVKAQQERKSMAQLSSKKRAIIEERLNRVADIQKWLNHTESQQDGVSRSSAGTAATLSRREEALKLPMNRVQEMKDWLVDFERQNREHASKFQSRDTGEYVPVTRSRVSDFSMASTAVENKSVNHLGSVAGVSNLSKWLVDFEHSNKDHYERSQRKEPVADRSDMRDTTFVDIAASGTEEGSLVENTEILDQKSPHKDVNISMMPTVNDDDVANDDDVSDWEDDYDALKKVDITIEPVQSNDTWENETIGDAYDDTEEDTSLEQEEECSSDYNEGEGDDSYDNYGRDGDMSYDNYEGKAEGEEEQESYEDEEKEGVDNQIVDESCLEGLKFEQNEVRDDENTTQEGIDNRVFNENESGTESLCDETEDDFFAFRNTFNQQTTFEDKESVLDCDVSRTDADVNGALLGEDILSSSVFAPAFNDVSVVVHDGKPTINEETNDLEETRNMNPTLSKENKKSFGYKFKSLFSKASCMRVDCVEFTNTLHKESSINSVLQPNNELDVAPKKQDYNEEAVKQLTAPFEISINTQEGNEGHQSQLVKQLTEFSVDNSHEFHVNESQSETLTRQESRRSSIMQYSPDSKSYLPCNYGNTEMHDSDFAREMVLGKSLSSVAESPMSLASAFMRACSPTSSHASTLNEFLDTNNQSIVLSGQTPSKNVSQHVGWLKDVFGSPMAADQSKKNSHTRQFYQ